MGEWGVERVSSNVHVIRFPNIKAGWSQRILLTGDRHHDNVHTNWKLEKQHLDQAKEENAPIIDIGDFFCLMQGKWDKRANQDELREQHRGNDYFDLVWEEAEEFYRPYTDNLALFGYGNHETSTIRHHQVDPLKNLTYRLSHHATRDDTLRIGGYAGWVLLRFQDGTRSQTIRIKYHHGYGGGGPVTKGVIQANRRAVYLPDATFVVSAHIHEAWTFPIKRERISKAGVVSQDIQYHISVPTYKDEYQAGRGFHIETGKPPKPVGCAWINFSYEAHARKIKSRVELDIV